MLPAKLYVGIKSVIVKTNKLLVLEKATRRDGLIWDLPGGRLNTGEMIEPALCRELAEELPGLDNFTIGEILFAHKKAEPLMDGTELCLLYYRVTAPDFEVVLSEEHTAFAWMSLEELAALKEPYGTVYPTLLRKFLASK